METGKRRWRRSTVILAAALAVVVLAGTAYAVWTVLKSTADSGFTAQSVGNLVINGVEGNHIVQSGVPTLNPGESVSQCIRFQDTPPAGVVDTVKFYTSAVTDSANGLGDYLNVVIDLDVPNAGVNGYASCAEAGTWTPGVFTGTLNGLPDDYAAGVLLATTPAGVSRQALMRVTFTLDAAAPVSISGETASAVFSFESVGS
jgi:hypothetical protein